MGKYNWEPFTEELAQKILSYSDNRQELLDKVRQIYIDYNDSLDIDKKIPNDKITDIPEIFPKCGWRDKKTRDIHLNDQRLKAIDPFTIFAYIYNGLEAGMPKSAEITGDVFGLTHRFPSEEFDGKGIPKTTSPCKTIVYYSVNDDYFSNSNPNSPQTYQEAMDFAWSFFENALLYDPINNNDDLFNVLADQFEKMYGLYYVDIVTTTINLFYIAPSKFLSLDLNTITYIKNNPDKFPESSKVLVEYEKRLSKTKKNPILGRDYLNLCKTVQREIDNIADQDLKSFSDLSYIAFASKDEATADSAIEGNSSISSAEDSANVDIENQNPGYLGNIIYYGIPGSGKSYKIKTDIIDRFNKEPDGGTSHYERILFHPDYTYSDFVGQILPQKDGTYEFVPGPFTRILKKAFEEPKKDFYLIIDEINRGNAPAIFGDIFQLLDRVEKGSPHEGESQYHINNKDIGDNLGVSEIFLPKNLSIIATMNTSDQNVFTLDTAFKRRWRMEYIKDNIEGAIDYKDLYIGDTGVTWQKFHDAINDTIKRGTSHIVSVEDKRLGAYFCTKDEITDITLFTNKVLRYLWDDVARLNKDIFKEGDTVRTFEEIYDARERENFFEFIFKNDLFQKLK